MAHGTESSVLPLCSIVVVAHMGEEGDLDQGKQHQLALSNFWMLWGYGDKYV